MSTYFPYRTSIRLSDFDYSSPNWYYVTICTHERENLFGQIKNEEMISNDIGTMINKWWYKLPEKFPWVKLSHYILMPNHLHGVIRIVGAIPRNRPLHHTGENMVSPLPINTYDGGHTGENMVSPLPINNTYDGLGQIISWFKRMSINEYINNVKTNNWPRFNQRLWQRNYYEHIIRDERELAHVRQYISDNPKNWNVDKLHM